MLLYCSKQGDNSLSVFATHDDSFTGLEEQYGNSPVILKVPGIFTYELPGKIEGFDLPALLVAIPFECERRIGLKTPQLVREAMTTYVNSRPAIAMAAGRQFTDQEKSDVATADNIMQWMVGPNGMQAAAKSMIQGGEQHFYLDEKWPQWDANNEGWDAFVARFK